MITNKHILIVEDEYLIGAMIADFLEDFGAIPVGPVPSVAEALAIIAKQPIDVAVIDWNLKGESGSSIGAALRERGIPFVISTGYGVVETAFVDAPVLNKPYGPHILANELERLLTLAQ
jgi:DNA-binding response OmpR family regulator